MNMSDLFEDYPDYSTLEKLPKVVLTRYLEDLYLRSYPLQKTVLISNLPPNMLPLIIPILGKRGDEHLLHLALHRTRS